MSVIFGLVESLLSVLPGIVLGTVHVKMNKTAHIIQFFFPKNGHFPLVIPLGEKEGRIEVFPGEENDITVETEYD